MGSSLRRLAPPMMFALGLAAMFAAERGLWANLTLATLLAAWIWAAIFAYGDRKRQRPPQPRTFAETEAQAREQRRLSFADDSGKLTPGTLLPTPEPVFKRFERIKPE